MGNSERVAVAAHLHVALRRKAGRVTDTDWMAVNDDYAREVLRLARDHARATGDEGLAALANKLQAVLQVRQHPPAVPLVQRVSEGLRPAKPAPAPAPPEAPERYVGGLR